MTPAPIVTMAGARHSKGLAEKASEQALGYSTPSTDVDSEDSHADLSTAARQPILSAGELELATARKRLEGEWVAGDGNICQVRFQTEMRGTCVIARGGARRTYMLLCDAQERAVWWGNHRHYCVRVPEICDDADRLVWHRPGMPKQQQEYVWHRPHATGTAPATEQRLGGTGLGGRTPTRRLHQRDCWAHGTVRQPSKRCQEPHATTPAEGEGCAAGLSPAQVVAGATKSSRAVSGRPDLPSKPQPAPAAKRWAPKAAPGAPEPSPTPVPAPAPSDREGLAAEAVRQIEEQLLVPKSGGFVWIDNWNQRYLRHLGTLRSFLESQPERFKLVPRKGKAYRVAWVQ